MSSYNLIPPLMPLLLSLLCFTIFQYSSTYALHVKFYKQSCPNVEKLVLDVIQSATKLDPTVPAGLLRMHFHDCFIEGCDASILLDSKENNTTEKDGPLNVSLHGFGVIDNAKEKIEKECPNVVSCADILAIAARDAVTLSGGPKWDVVKGRMDSKVSIASNFRGKPPSSFNVSELLQSFSLSNLSLLDMVTLSGGHTLGFGHCSSFNTRLYQFSKTNVIDPTMDPSFAQKLRSLCPLNKNSNNDGAFLDDTRFVFDNNYYINLVKGRGVFTSDQSLFLDPRTKHIVEDYSSNQQAFFSQFSKSMVKMSKVGIKTKSNGEIRANCHIVNPS